MGSADGKSKAQPGAALLGVTSSKKSVGFALEDEATSRVSSEGLSADDIALTGVATELESVANDKMAEDQSNDMDPNRDSMRESQEEDTTGLMSNRGTATS